MAEGSGCSSWRQGAHIAGPVLGCCLVTSAGWCSAAGGASIDISLQHSLCAMSCLAVQSCEPAVAGMPQLLARLNAGDSFSRFVRCMRQEFQAVVREEMQQQQQQPAAAEELVAC